MAVYFFWGQEEYLMEKEIKKLKNELLDASFLSMAYKIFDNPPYTELMDCIQSAPLMFGNSLSIISINKYLLGNSKITLDDKQTEYLDFALSNISPNMNIIFICKTPRDDKKKKPDSRTKFYKTISKYSQVREFAEIPDYKPEFNTQIVKMAKEKGLTISSSAVNIIKEQLGTNLVLIDSELEKLQIAVFPNKNIEKEDILKYCTVTEDVFYLADLIVSGNKNKIIKQYNLLTDKKDPLEIFGALQSSFQRFIFIKNYEKKMSVRDMASFLRPLPEFVITKIQEKLRNTSLERLIKIRKNLITAEYKLKTGQTVSGETTLELALLS
jgi:DNA polymerase-3 subunit delta